jgi:hypothetical protein
MSELITSTAQWSLVIHRVTSSSVEVWVGTLFPTLKKPKAARVRLSMPGGGTRTRQIIKADWKRPFRKMNQRFYTVCTFQNLKPGTRYTLTFDRRIETLKGAVAQQWQSLRSGTFDTLLTRIPLKGQKPFTIALGSCFYNHRDGGQAAASYKALYERGADSVRPDVTILSGDQVYLDIGFDSLSLRPDEVRQRMADDYAQHWQAMGSILNRGGTWMIPDDHEYWNDYPFYDSLIPTLLALKLPWVRKAWDGAATDAVKNVQRSPVVETFSFGKDLSVALADLRSFRKGKKVVPTQMLDKLVDWAKALKGPGVLVSPQPVIVEENKSERNLLSFPDQFATLLRGLAYSGHDIVLLSGDVHFGRIATVDLGNNGARLIEIIASPLSNLTGLNGLATSVAKSKPPKFPDPSVITMEGWKPAKVKYDKAFQVDTKKGRWFSAYPRARTREHFMTISFNRLNSGGLELTADAWRVRERSGPKNLPVKDFKKTFKFKLK